MLRGSCLCGQVRYETDATGPVFNCHCGRCRKWHGAAFATGMRVPVQSLRITAGGDNVTRYSSSPGVERCFCRTCGSSLFTIRHDMARAHIRLGTIDGDPGVRPQLHVFVASKAPWFEITDTLPQNDAMPADR